MKFILGNNTYSFYDNYLISNPKIGEFYSISNHFSSQDAYEDCSFGVVSLYLDNESVHYERRVYNLYDMIGDVGGIYQVVFTLFYFFSNRYTSKLYGLQMINGLHQSQTLSKVTPINQSNPTPASVHNIKNNRFNSFTRRANTLNMRYYHNSNLQKALQQNRAAKYKSKVVRRINNLENNQEEI